VNHDLSSLLAKLGLQRRTQAALKVAELKRDSST
jgi:DNA-binding CsgD family transcriptional regulator